MISFLLLILGSAYSSFSRCLKGKVRLFIWVFSSFLRYVCIVKNFHLRTAFAVSHRFWIILSSLSFASTYLLISSLIYLIIHWFSSKLFSLQEFVGFFLLLYSSVLLLGLHLRHMEVLGLRVESELQMLAYTTATSNMGSKPHLWPTP